jgi:hypothetical protein
MKIDDFGSVSMESIMDTVTRVYLGITVLGLSAQVAFPFYNNVNVRKNDVGTAMKNYTTTYLNDLCFNKTGDPQYGGCPTPAIPLVNATTT